MFEQFIDFTEPETHAADLPEHVDIVSAQLLGLVSEHPQTIDDMGLNIVPVLLARNDEANTLGEMTARQKELECDHQSESRLRASQPRVGASDSTYGRPLKRNCYSLPGHKLQSELIRLYFKNVHPLCPVIDEQAFYQLYHKGSRHPIQPIVFQAMLFAAFPVRQPLISGLHSRHANKTPYRIVFE